MEHSNMPSEPQPAHYPVHAPSFGFSKKQAKQEEPRWSAHAQDASHWIARFLTFTVCAESEKRTRTVARFVHVTVFLNKSRIPFGEETRTHVCGAIRAVRSTRTHICDKYLTL